MIVVEPGEAPLIVSIPHAGTDIPEDITQHLRDPDLARRDADLHVDRLYAFAGELGATIVRTPVSRTVIDVNRDPSGVSLYPGQATTGLCPLTTFDGEPLWRVEPDEAEVERRKSLYFAPYHAALVEEIARLKARHRTVVLYDAHSIRSRVPRLFEGELPNFNIGTNSGASCALELTRAVERACDIGAQIRVTDGRFKGGWITRHYGRPETGVHAIQMELAMRTYLDEAAPLVWNMLRAEPCRMILREILVAAIAFAEGQS